MSLSIERKSNAYVNNFFLKLKIAFRSHLDIGENVTALLRIRIENAISTRVLKT